jgi:hypothetical protein
MALTWTNFASFDEVVKHYKKIKPLVSKMHTREDDIRPIGDRNRKQERIVKISRNCYALSEGYHMGDDKFPYWGAVTWDNQGKVKTVDTTMIGKMEYYAPIVWRKHKDGTETVRVQNFTGSDGGYEITRYAFLERHVPRGMSFVMGSNSRQYVSLNGVTTADAHFLAKCKTVPSGVFNKDRENKYSQWKQRKDDNAALVFFKTSDGSSGQTNWLRDPTTGKSLPEGAKVNKELKAKYKEAIKNFFEWGMTMSPLLPLEDRDYRSDKMKEIAQHFHPEERYDAWLPKYAREVLRDENHPMRLQYWVMFACSCTDGWGWNENYLVKQVETSDDLKRVRSRYNSFINNNAGFINKPCSY